MKEYSANLLPFSIRSLTLLLVITLASATSQAQDRLLLLTGKWPPYTSEELDGFGVQTEIVTAVVREMGMEPEYKFVPWKRGELMVKQGKAFAIFPYSKTDKRSEAFDFSIPIFYTATYLFYYKERTTPKQYKVLEELRSYTIGGVLGHSYVAQFEKAGLDTRLVQKDKQLIPMLWSSRVDLVAMDGINGWLEIKRLYPEEIDGFATLDKSISGRSASRLMMSRNYPGAAVLQQRFNKALQGIKFNGKYRAILDKYHVQGIFQVDNIP